MGGMRKWNELPIWGLAVALAVCSSAFIAISFHPALRDDHKIARLFFYAGLICLVGTLFGAVQWLVAIWRGRVPKSSLSESGEQILRNADKALEQAKTLLEEQALKEPHDDNSTSGDT